MDITKFVGEVHEYIGRAFAPLVKRLEALEQRAAVIPERGEKGEKGDRGDAAQAPTFEQLSEIVAAYLKANPPARGEKGDPGASVKGDPGQDAQPVSRAALFAALVEYFHDNPLPKGEKGDPGTSVKGDPGQDAPPVTREALLEAVASHLTANPPARGEKGEQGFSVKGDRGEPGEPGADAVVSYEDIVRAVDEVHERLTAKHVLDIERRGMDAIQRAIDRLPMPKDGKDGLGFDDISADYDGLRTVTLRFRREGQEKAYPFVMPVVIDRGFWREGFKAQKGDAVTHDGAWWIAQKDTDVKPSITAKDDWRIAARKGRDGNHGKNGKDAPGAVDLSGN